MATNTSTLSPEDVRIGETLRALRESRGIRVGEFALQLGISPAYLSNIEAGRKKLTKSLAVKAAQLLDYRVAALIRPDHFPVQVAS
jgi:transcriptional regulator with XRE-family HTH domain